MVISRSFRSCKVSKGKEKGESSFIDTRTNRLGGFEV